MSLRLRLTIWYVGLLAIILVGFAFVVYYLQERAMLDQVDAELKTYAQTTINLANRDVLIRYITGRAVEFGPPVQDTPGFAPNQVYLQFSNAGGTIGYQNPHIRDTSIPLTEDIQQIADTGRPVVLTAILPENDLLRVYTQAVFVDGQVAGYVQVAQLINGVYTSLRRLATLLVAGIIAALAIAALVGILLAEAALRPIDSVTQTALRITQTDDLSRRIIVPAKAPQDEVTRLAEIFNLMLDRIETLFSTQQRFIADVSHELRTPLTTIRGNLALIKRSGHADPESLADMQSETERMSRLVRDLLLLAQADAGVTLQRTPIELDSLLLEVYRQGRVIAEQTASGVTVRLGPEDQATVMGDTDRLRQLLLNLVENGIKYTPPGGSVTLGLERDDNWVSVSVRDTGVGIPAEDLPHVFERFYRVDKARSREKGGTGLGLSIAQWIAQAHGGRLEVDSEIGAGTVFTLTLPVAQPESTAHHTIVS
ncbi:MAG: ATP-binding protein [Anaerolineae bacterium]